ncbi:MAG TPA: GAF domain-containing protein [Polyangiaceae bacterium]|nr:GAF domain-containing protein [Polyangiaceae bacterium]
MQLRVHAAGAFEPTPHWLVSDGDLIVGPIATELLVRGVRSGRIPPECSVCSTAGGDFRRIDQVREIRAALSPAVSEAGPERRTGARSAVQWLSDARDANEVLLLALHGACELAFAQVGALYRVRFPLDLPVLSASYGDPCLDLGEVVPRRDAAWQIAQEGEPVALRPRLSAAARAMESRLCIDREPMGLAIVPIRTATELFGVVELARFDHPFRAADVRALVPLMSAGVARLEELSPAA